MLERAACLLIALSLSGCSHLAYYSQAVGGHLTLSQAARPVREVLASPATGPELRARLERAQAIRDFASRELALPDNGSYRNYADLGRPYVVWNVFAAPELSTRLERWCWVFVGCVAYRGFFEQAKAEAFAREMRERGHDTHVVGVVAYSTLGVFEDPLLNTFMEFDESELARLIFHELAHQRVFAAGDTAFNESFATTVENEGVRRWLGSRDGTAAQAAFAARQGRRAQMAALVTAYRDRLDAALAAAPSAAAQRAEKGRIIGELRQAYAELKSRWDGYEGYDDWFGDGLNNARIASIGLYHQHVPAFQAMLAAEAGDLAGFFRRVEALAALDGASREAGLAEQAPTATAATHDGDVTGGGVGRTGSTESAAGGT